MELVSGFAPIGARGFFASEAGAALFWRSFFFFVRAQRFAARFRSPAPPSLRLHRGTRIDRSCGACPPSTARSRRPDYRPSRAKDIYLRFRTKPADLRLHRELAVLLDLLLQRLDLLLERVEHPRIAGRGGLFFVLAAFGFGDRAAHELVGRDLCFVQKCKGSSFANRLRRCSSARCSSASFAAFARSDGPARPRLSARAPDALWRSSRRGSRLRFSQARTKPGRSSRPDLRYPRPRAQIWGSIGRVRPGFLGVGGFGVVSGKLGKRSADIGCSMVPR